MLDLNELIWDDNGIYKGMESRKSTGLGFEYIVTRDRLVLFTLGIKNSASLEIGMSQMNEAKYFAQLHHNAVRMACETFNASQAKKEPAVEGRVVDLKT